MSLDRLGPFPSATAEGGGSSCFCAERTAGGLAVADGLVLRGRLVKLIEPRAYKTKAGEDRTAYPAVVVLAGDETARVEYRTLDERDDALLLAGFEGKPDADGMVPTLPPVELIVRAVGAWDAAAGRFAPARFSGA